MPAPIVLASGSEIRHSLLSQAGVKHDVERPRVDETSIKDALLAEHATPREIANTLAELKARKVSEKHPASMVIGCDQVLSHEGQLMSKPSDKSDLKGQLLSLRGRKHELFSALVICEAGQPVWRDIGVVTLNMRTFSDSYLDAYIDRNWESVQHSVGGYKLEEEGVRLFSEIKGDYFTVLGLPMLSLLSYLGQREMIVQ